MGGAVFATLPGGIAVRGAWVRDGAAGATGDVHPRVETNPLPRRFPAPRRPHRGNPGQSQIRRRGKLFGQIINVTRLRLVYELQYGPAP